MLRERVASGKRRSEIQRECLDTVLRLWEYRHAWPSQAFKEVGSVAEALVQLSRGRDSIFSGPSAEKNELLKLSYSVLQDAAEVRYGCSLIPVSDAGKTYEDWIREADKAGAGGDDIRTIRVVLDAARVYVHGANGKGLQDLPKTIDRMCANLRKIRAVAAMRMKRSKAAVKAHSRAK